MNFSAQAKGLAYMIASAATNYKVDVVFVGVAIFMAMSGMFTPPSNNWNPA